MPVSDEYLDHLVDMLAPMAAVGVRRMFGGAGLYAHERMFALVADDRLYIKTDAVNLAEFEAAGCDPFMYQPADGAPKAMSYYAVPEGALDDADDLINWCRLGVEAALRQPAKTKRKTKTRTSATQSASKSKG